MGQESEFIAASEMRELLRAVYAGDEEGKLLGSIARRLRDPAKPLDQRGRPRLNPLWLALLVIGFTAVAAFAVFATVER